VLAFHHTVAQLLFMLTKARRDIRTAVAFLTTRVKRSDEDDWGKLKQVLKYLNGTRYLKLKLSVDSLVMLKWCTLTDRTTCIGIVRDTVERCSR
jgi:hypothetical protein